MHVARRDSSASSTTVGVLTAGDVHVALRLGELADVDDEWVLLAGAFAVRAPRLANVTVDLATIHDTATVESDEEVDLSTLPWPPAAEWIARVGASGLVAVGDVDGDETSPFRLVGSNLYLDRYWKEEGGLASDLLALSEQSAPSVDIALLREGLTRLFPDETASRQCLAAASAVLRRLTVVAGGPGTGKTTTVARIVALLVEQAAGELGSARLSSRSPPRRERPHRVSKRRCTTRHGTCPSTTLCGLSFWGCRRPRSTGFSAGARTATAVSATTADDASLTTS